MSASIVFEWIRIVELYVTIFIIVFMIFPKLPDGSELQNDKIAEIAKRDLSHLGRYDERLTVSVKYWVFAIEVALYYENKYYNALDMLHSWNEKYNYDPKGFILQGIEAAHSTFLLEVDKARNENREPKFKVAKEYDYHMYPLNFKYNDYIVAAELLADIDSILGGA